MDHCDPETGALLTSSGLIQVALMGSPNSGKTTLFNALTGLNAKTANYPGVTVARREGLVEVGEGVRLVDLPGTYSLRAISPDEQVVADALGGRVAGVEPPNAIVAVADATTLSRSLLFVAEILALGLPTCLVLTMVDEVVARGGSIDTERLSGALGIPVVGIIGHRGIGVDQVRTLLANPTEWPTPVLPPPSDPERRSGWVDSVYAAGVTSPGPDERSRRIDQVLLHPILGTVVFVVVMLAFFQSIFTLATPLADGLDGVVARLASEVHRLIPGIFGEFLADGVIAGVGSVIVFIPQITLLFLILSLLEKVGYLSRAAFLADRVMGRFGLEGRSFVSMLSAFACAIPGIMSTRTIPSERRRLATMMATPLMTCSARLPVFTLLIGGFVPDRQVFGPFRTQGLAMFALYVVGAVSGLLYAALLNRFAGVGSAAPFVMEIPPYRLPTLKAVARATWDGAWSFLRKAGTIIFASSAVLWLMLHVPSATPPAGLTEVQQQSYRMEHSIAGRAGKVLVPVFKPLGYEWHTNVALIGSLAAREVFVSTLALTVASADDDKLPAKLNNLKRPDGSKVFNGPTVASLLIFFVYALQCTSTIAVLRRETNSWKWPGIAFGSMFALAYVGALIARLTVQFVS